MCQKKDLVFVQVAQCVENYTLPSKNGKVLDLPELSGFDKTKNLQLNLLEEKTNLRKMRNVRVVLKYCEKYQLDNI